MTRVHHEDKVVGPGAAGQPLACGAGRGGRGGGREWRGVGGQLRVQVRHRVMLWMTFEQGELSVFMSFVL